MRLLVIGSDRNVFKEGSAVRARVMLQARAAGEMHIVVFSRRAHGLKETHDGPLHLYPTDSYSRLLYVPDAARAAARLPRPDIVSAQDPFEAGLAARRAARRAGAKLQLQLHTDALSPLFAASSMLNGLRSVLARFLLRRADCVRVVSEPLADELRARGVRAPITVLPIFIDAEAIAAAPALNLRQAYPQFGKLVLVAARLAREKHLDLLLRAMQGVLRSFPDAGLLIAGKGPERGALEHLAESYGITNQVVFLGNRSDVFSLYKGADLVLAATAPYEGYGAATVEALAAGCPVVSTDVGIARAAGAQIAAPRELTQAAVEALSTGARGKLLFTLPSAEEWTQKWKEGIEQCR